MKSEYVFRVAKAIMLSAMLALGISLPACASGDDAQDQSHYQLSFDADTPRQVHVEAQVTVTGQRLRMFLYGQPFLENGWATWVEDLQASTTDGTPVEARLREGGWGSWEIDVPDGTRVNLSYTVNLTQDEYDWDSVGGQDGRPTWSNGAFYGVTRAFFIYSDHDQQMTVQIDRPDGWRMASPWQLLPGADNLYAVPNLDSLVSNALVLGDFDLLSTENGSMRIELALDRQLSAYGEEFLEVLGTLLDEYARIYDGTPDINYVVAIRAADEHDGEAFYSSFNMVVVPERLDGPRIAWAGVLGHELFHLWNGANFLRGEDKSTLEWFTEGFTEYYSSLSLMRTGLID